MAVLKSRSIARALRTAPCFAGLSDVQVGMLASGGQERIVPRYSVLFREGSEARSFYVLLKGRLESSSTTSTHKTDVSAPVLSKADGVTKEGVCLGYEGLSGGLRRLTTVTTLDECTVLHFSTDGVMLDSVGMAGLASHVFTQVVSTALHGCDFFAGVIDPTIEALAPHFKLEEVHEAGKHVYREGGNPDRFYLLLEGTVALFSGDVQVGTLPELGTSGASILGEDAVLSTAPRSFTAVTLSPCKLLYLPRAKFRYLHLLMPDLPGQLRRYHMLHQHLHSTASRFTMPTDPDEAERVIKAAIILEKDSRVLLARKHINGIRKQRARAAVAQDQKPDPSVPTHSDEGDHQRE